MRELIERLEKADAGSRELDGQIEVVARWVMAARAGLAPEHRARWKSGRLGQVYDGNTGYDAQPVTTSLDAALALAERVLPGWLWEATTITTTIGGIRKPLAVVVDPEGENDDVRTFGTAATPALAFCIAILRALRTTEQHSPVEREGE